MSIFLFLEERISFEQIKQITTNDNDLNKSKNYPEQKSISECPEHIKCLNGGICVNDPLEGFKCECSSQYTGFYCENSNNKLIKI